MCKYRATLKGTSGFKAYEGQVWVRMETIIYVDRDLTTSEVLFSPTFTRVRARGTGAAEKRA